MVLYATVWGAGWVGDSYQYIGSARSLAHQGKLAYPGSGEILIPLTHYPPAFPVVLACFEWLGLDAYVMVRYFHGFLFGVMILLVGVTVYRISHSYPSSLLASLLTLFSAALLERHAWALSEPLFLVATVGGFLAVDVFFKTNKRIALLLALICFTVAWLTRYVGVVAIITIICIYALVNQRYWKQRVVDIGLALVLPTAPILLWTVRNFQLEGRFLNRSLTFTPLGEKNWLSIIQNLAGWVLPGRVILGREKWLLIGGVVAVFFLALWWIYENRRKETSPLKVLRSMPLIPTYILYGVIYVPVVILSKLFFDPMIGFTERMLIPTQLSVIIIVPVGLNYLWKTQGWFVKVVVVTAALLLLFYYVNEGTTRLERLHRQGLGIANRRWHESQVIKLLPTLGGGEIYSNSQSSMYLWTGRAGRYFTELVEISAFDDEQPIYLVVFHYLKANARLQKLMDRSVRLEEDGIATIYLYQPRLEQ
ncbi:MAG: hypothetical protein Kow0088_13730 [Anaerolineales bacterium]